MAPSPRPPSSSRSRWRAPVRSRPPGRARPGAPPECRPSDIRLRAGPRPPRGRVPCSAPWGWSRPSLQTPSGGGARARYPARSPAAPGAEVPAAPAGVWCGHRPCGARRGPERHRVRRGSWGARRCGSRSAHVRCGPALGRRPSGVRFRSPSPAAGRTAAVARTRGTPSHPPGLRALTAPRRWSTCRHPVRPRAPGLRSREAPVRPPASRGPAPRGSPAQRCGTVPRRGRSPEPPP